MKQTDNNKVFKRRLEIKKVMDATMIPQNDPDFYEKILPKVFPDLVDGLVIKATRK